MPRKCGLEIDRAFDRAFDLAVRERDAELGAKTSSRGFHRRARGRVEVDELADALDDGGVEQVFSGRLGDDGPFGHRGHAA